MAKALSTPAEGVLVFYHRWTLAARLPLTSILNHMVQRRSTLAADSFAALADDTRRGVLEELGHSDASITDLAARFEMTLTGMSKHVRILERVGLVATEKVGRVRYCRLGTRRLDDAATWIETYQRLWDARFRELDAVINEMQGKVTRDGRSDST